MDDNSTGEEWVQALIKSGQVNERYEYRRTALIMATINGDIASVKALIAANADLDIQDYFSRTALMSAVEWKKPEALNALIAANADLDIQNDFGNTALMLAVMRGTNSALDVLIAAGAKLNLQNIYGQTALMSAVTRKNNYALNALIAAGAKLNLQDDLGNTALMWAAIKWVANKGDVETVRILLAVEGIDRTGFDQYIQKCIQQADQERKNGIFELKNMQIPDERKRDGIAFSNRRFREHVQKLAEMEGVSLESFGLGFDESGGGAGQSVQQSPTVEQADFLRPEPK